MESVSDREERRDYFERSFLRNTKKFSAVFERIYFKVSYKAKERSFIGSCEVQLSFFFQYNREFENDEPGGKELTNEDLLDWKDEEEGERRFKRGRNSPIPSSFKIQLHLFCM